MIQSLTKLLGTAPAARGVTVGPGDDAAVLRPPPGKDLVVTTDVQVEGRHFEPGWLSGTDLGWRLAAVNLSDIAAMGAEARYAVLSLCVPPKTGDHVVRSIQRGVHRHLARYGAALVGGNLSGIARTLVCELTLIGACARGRAWRRTCRPGRDAIVVVGALGDAAAGCALLARGERAPARLIRAFKRPTPRIDVARLLARERAVHGAIDVSDGFAADLMHLCRGGGAGAEVDAGGVPISPALRSYCQRPGRAPLEFALEGGEDYALILSVDERRADAVAARIERVLGVGARVVGRFTRAPGRYRLVDAAGRSRRLTAGGWDHFAA